MVGVRCCVLRRTRFITEMINRDKVITVNVIPRSGLWGIFVAVIHVETVGVCARRDVGLTHPNQRHFIDAVEFLNLEFKRGLVIRHHANVVAVFIDFTEIAEITWMQTDQHWKINERLFSICTRDRGIDGDFLTRRPIFIPPSL